MTTIISAKPVPNRRGLRWFQAAMSTLDRSIESVAALLVLLEFFIISLGVVARFFFHNPITWIDEVAGALFLWLGMLGAVIALRHSEHMRLTVIVDRLPPERKQLVETICSFIVIGFLAAIFIPSFSHFEAQIPVTLQQLEISDGWRAASSLIAIILMIVVSVRHLSQVASAKDLLISAGVAILVAGVVFVLSPVIIGMGNFNLLIFFCFLLAVCIALGVPIAFAFGAVTLGYLGTVTSVPFEAVVGRIDEGMSNTVLLAIPLFILLGYMIEMTGVAQALVRCVTSVFGNMRGGLSYSLVGAMYLVSGISGSKAADMAAIAPGLLPEMEKQGADRAELAALLASSGAMSETIPPSIVLIMVGSVAGVSISQLFTGGLLPAAICALGMALVIYFRTRREKAHQQKFSWTSVSSVLFAGAPALALPFLIRFAVQEGIATATEVSAVGIVYSMLAGLFIYRKFEWGKLHEMLVRTAALSGAILLIMGTASAMAWALTQSGFSRQLVTLMIGVPGGALGFLLISVLAFAILGSVLEGLPAILVFAPLLFPVARALGIHDVHYSIVIIVAMGLGLFAPPFGVGYYAACAISKVSPNQTMPRIWPYLAGIAGALILIVLFPWISVGLL